MKAKRDGMLQFQAQLIKSECKVTIENDKEYTIVFKTMDERAKEMETLVSNWVVVQAGRVRGA